MYNLMERENILDQVSYQSIFYISVGFLITVLAFIILNFRGVPYASVMVLLLIGMFGSFAGAYSVNCMVVGGCFTWAWISTLIGITAIFFTMFGHTFR
jgi:hypothetical protein